MKRYEALITRADALGDDADRLSTGSVNVSNTAARAISDDVTRLAADYLGAVEERRVISHALTLALRDRVSDITAAKDALIKRAAEDLNRHGGQSAPSPRNEDTK